MRRYDLEVAVIEELREEEIPAVLSITEGALGSTFDAYHSADTVPAQEDDEEDHHPAPQYFGDCGAAYKILVDGEVIGALLPKSSDKRTCPIPGVALLRYSD